MIVNIIALAWGGSMLVNWLRPASNPTLNTCLNPSAAASGASLGGLGDVVPIFEAVVAVIVIVGAICYFVAQLAERIAWRKRPDRQLHGGGGASHRLSL